MIYKALLLISKESSLRKIFKNFKVLINWSDPSVNKHNAKNFYCDFPSMKKNFLFQGFLN